MGGGGGWAGGGGGGGQTEQARVLSDKKTRLCPTHGSLCVCKNGESVSLPANKDFDVQLHIRLNSGKLGDLTSGMFLGRNGTPSHRQACTVSPLSSSIIVIIRVRLCI